MGGVAKPLLQVGGRSLLARAIDAVRAVDDAIPITVVGPRDENLAHRHPEIVWVREDPPFTGPAAAIVAALSPPPAPAPPAALASCPAPASPSSPPAPASPSPLAPAPPAAPAAPAPPSSPSAPASPGVAPTPADRAPEWTFVLACDLPLIDAAVLRLWNDILLLPSDTDGLCLADPSSRPQWLTGVYRTAALADAARRLPDSGRDASVRALLDDLAIAVIAASADLTADVDTWEDLDQARRRAGDGERA